MRAHLARRMVQWLALGLTLALLLRMPRASAGYVAVLHESSIFNTGYWAALEAEIDLKPETLNLRGRGQPVTCFIELSAGYDVHDIDLTALRLEAVIPAAAHPYEYGDRDGDGLADLMVKFSRDALRELLGERTGDVLLHVSGALRDGTAFEGTDTIRLIHPPQAPGGVCVRDPHTGSQLVISWQGEGEPGKAAVPADKRTPAAAYRLYRSTTPEGPFTLVMADAVLEYTDQQLTFGVTYYYRVTAVDAFGLESEPSEVAGGQPSRPAPSAQPTPTTEVTATPEADPSAAPPEPTGAPTERATAAPTSPPESPAGASPVPTATPLPDETAVPTALPEPSATEAPPSPTSEPFPADTPAPTSQPPPKDPAPTADRNAG